MASLKNESELFKQLEDEFLEHGDKKETFFKCIKICKEYVREERLFLLYRLKQLNEVELKNDTLDIITQAIKMFLKKNTQYGFFIAVIEASLEE